MGATSAMYDSMCPEIEFEVNFIDWPEYRGETTYLEVAQRVIEENKISDGDIVGGSSLGGMVALEIAKCLKSEAVILLGSAISRREIQGMLSVLSPLAAVTPVSLIQVLAEKHNSLAAQMFSRSTLNLFGQCVCIYPHGQGIPARWNSYSAFTDGEIMLFRVPLRVRKLLKKLDT